MQPSSCHKTPHPPTPTTTNGTVNTSPPPDPVSRPDSQESAQPARPRHQRRDPALIITERHAGAEVVRSGTGPAPGTSVPSTNPVDARYRTTPTCSSIGVRQVPRTAVARYRPRTDHRVYGPRRRIPCSTHSSEAGVSRPTLLSSRSGSPPRPIGRGRYRMAPRTAVMRRPGQGIAAGRSGVAAINQTWSTARDGALVREYDLSHFGSRARDSEQRSPHPRSYLVAAFKPDLPNEAQWPPVPAPAAFRWCALNGTLGARQSREFTARFGTPPPFPGRATSRCSGAVSRRGVN
jgi:hypothetical protein